MEEKDSARKFLDLRQRAEALLQSTSTAPNEISRDEFLSLLHELEVHQIELEMQTQELQKTQIELEEARHKYADLYDFSPVGHSTLNAAREIVEVNLTLAVLLGVERNDLLKKSFSHFIYPGDQDIFYHFYLRIFQTQGPASCELRLVRRDGSLFYAGLEGIVARDADGCQIAVSDVTWRKETEEALAQSENYHRSLFEHSPIALLEEDFSEVKAYLDRLRDRGIANLRAYFDEHPEAVRETMGLIKVLRMNPAAMQLYKTQSIKELLSRTDRVAPPDTLGPNRDQLLAIAEGRTEFSREMVRYTLAGDRRELEVRWSVVPGYEQTYSHMIFSLIDITERKRVEEVLRQNEAYYRSLFDNSPIALFEEDFSEIKIALDQLRDQGITNLRAYFDEYPEALRKMMSHLKILRMNSSAGRLFQVQSIDQLFGQMDDVIPHETRDANRDFFIAIAEGRTDFSREMVRYTLAGDRLDIETRWLVVPGYEKTYARVIFSMIDMTERRRVENALRDSETHYRSLFEHSPIALMEEDLSEVKAHLEQLRGQGITDLRAYFDEHPEAVREMPGRIKVLRMNPAAGRLYKAESVEELLSHTDRVVPTQFLDANRDLFLAVAEGKTELTRETGRYTLTGDRLDIEERWLVVPGHEETYSHVIFSVIDMTERRRVENALRESEARYRLLAENMADVVWILDVDTLRFTYVSPSAERLLGYTPEEMLLQSIDQVMTPASFDMVTRGLPARVQDFLAGGPSTTSQPREVEQRCKDGSTVWTEIVTTFFKDSAGRVQVLGVSRDITARLEAEAEVRSLAKYPAQNPAPVLRLYQDGTILHANAASRWLLEEWNCAIGDPAPTLWREQVAKALSSRSNQTIDFQYRNQAWSFFIVPIINERYAHLYGRDITAHRRTEAALQASEWKYRHILQTMVDGMVIVDPQGQIIDTNPAAQHILGLAIDRITGKYFDSLDLQLVDDQGRPFPPEQLPLTVVLREHRAVERLEHAIIDPHGQWKWLSINAAPLFDEHGELYGAIANFRDVTNRKRVEIAEHEQRTLAEALTQVAAALNRTLDLDKVLELILDHIGRVVPHDAANIMLIEAGKAWVVRQHGYSSSEAENPFLSQHFSIAALPSLREMVEIGQPKVITDTAADPDWAYFSPGPILHSYVGAPIQFEGKTIGLLNLSSITPAFFTPAHAERLQAFADQAAVAIQNAQLYQQSRALAAMEERQRLARDLHDAVSQTLFSASVVAETLPRLWERYPDEVRAGLDELHRLTRGGLSEMRTLLLELRPTALIETELDELVRQLTMAFSDKTRVEVSLELAGKCALSPEVHTMLYRIVQESLNNITKHARATHVLVSLVQGPKRVELRVCDNGRGFDMAHVSPERLGLSIMKERAKSIGAKLKITSQVGQGTQIVVLWSDEISGEST